MNFTLGHSAKAQKAEKSFAAKLNKPKTRGRKKKINKIKEGE